MRHGFDRGDDRARRVGDVVGQGAIGIAGIRQFEQIGAFRPRQHQGAGETGQGLGRGFDIAALFDPGAPGDADAGPRRQFFPPQTGRAPSPRRPFRAQPLAMGAHKGAQ